MIVDWSMESVFSRFFVFFWVCVISSCSKVVRIGLCMRLVCVLMISSVFLMFLFIRCCCSSRRVRLVVLLVCLKVVSSRLCVFLMLFIWFVVRIVWFVSVDVVLWGVVVLCVLVL